MMDAIAHKNSAVIVRLDRTIQYAATLAFHQGVCVYWIPAFVGMASNARMTRRDNEEN
jgi:hypothetical protein